MEHRDDLSMRPAPAEPFRPAFHYSPARNWMNDPNGLVWYDGEYHLFYQHNPLGTEWGNMSWGHAVSADLRTWEELPVAIPYTAAEEVFSGCIVVDHANTSGLGSAAEPPFVALYTSVDTSTGLQAQSIAHSSDRGRTWSRYAGNPVLDLDSSDFRDPKVFWYADGGYWVMVVMLAAERIVQFYRSDNLIEWAHLSDFGPLDSTAALWECPDLFELPVEGDGPEETRWVLVVSVNPGAPAGGSGTRYFLGDFDGKCFTPDPDPARRRHRPLVRLRRGLLCAGLLQRRPGRRARPDRLDEQLGLRGADPDLVVPWVHDPAARLPPAASERADPPRATTSRARRRPTRAGPGAAGRGGSRRSHAAAGQRRMARRWRSPSSSCSGPRNASGCTSAPPGTSGPSSGTTRDRRRSSSTARPRGQSSSTRASPPSITDRSRLRTAACACASMSMPPPWRCSAGRASASSPTRSSLPPTAGWSASSPRPATSRLAYLDVKPLQPLPPPSS